MVKAKIECKLISDDILLFSVVNRVYLLNYGGIYENTRLGIPKENVIERD